MRFKKVVYKKIVNKNMIDFTQQEKEAKKANKNAVDQFFKKMKLRRITQQERIEKNRYKKLKKIARKQQITISKLLDEVIDQFINS